jgi:limonene-1,2-epoxide hydrolase
MTTNLPSQSLSIQDPGLGLAQSAGGAPVFIGGSSAGTAGAVQAFTRISDVIDALGDGPLVEDLCFAIQNAGGPVVGVKAATSVAAANSAVTTTRKGTSTGTVTVAGTALDSFTAKIKITTTGTTGAGAFQFTLDNGRTWSAAMTIPSGGTYVIPHTGITATFTPGIGAVYFEADDLFAFTTTAAAMNTTDLSGAITALKADGRAFEGIYLSGTAGTSSAAAVIGAAFDSHLESFATLYRYVHGMLDAGGWADAPGARTDWLSLTTKRYLPCYGSAWVASALPTMGKGYVKRSTMIQIATRAIKSLISTHLGRVADGPLPAMAPATSEFGAPVSWDEYVSEAMDAAGFATLRTWAGRSGYYVTQPRIKAPAGSDYTKLHRRRVMDRACTVVQGKLLDYANAGVRVNADGTIDEGDAKRIEAAVNADLRTALLEPFNAEGTKGHASAASCQVDRSNNVGSSETLQATVAIRSLGYLEKQVVLIGYVAASRA